MFREHSCISVLKVYVCVQSCISVLGEYVS
jgi:hypothetical protein